MDKVFARAEDKNVIGTFVYGNGTDGYAYCDDEHKHYMSAPMLKNLFFKGSFISIQDVIYKPVSMNVVSNEVVVTYVKTDTSTTTTAVLGTLSSKTEA
mgnify:FL=1|jgi:hypothetical protein